MECAERDICCDEERGCGAWGEDGVPEVFDEGCHCGRGRVERAVSECLGVWSGLGRASRADEGCVGLESALGGVGEGVY